jgi:hypothetical protein
VKYQLSVLHGCTFVFLVTLVALAFTAVSRSPVRDSRADEDEAQRNERSTPRSFILPATPAVAEEQEQQVREAKEGVDVFGCLEKLRLLGYGADNTPPALRATNLEAIFRFQKEHGLTPNARLDRETVRLLKCKR